MIHRMAKSYGMLPTEVMELDLMEFQVNAAIMMAGDNAEAKAHQKAIQRARAQANS